MSIGKLKAISIVALIVLAGLVSIHFDQMGKLQNSTHQKSLTAGSANDIWSSKSITDSSNNSTSSFVSKTVNLANGKVYNGNKKLPEASYPTDAFYLNGTVYVTNFGGGIDTINGTTVTNSIQTEGDGGIAYDPQNGFLYTSGGSVIHDGIVVKKIAFPAGNAGIAYDSKNGLIYVAGVSFTHAGGINYYNFTMSTINSNGVVSNITLRSSTTYSSVITYSEGVVYDPSENYVYVADSLGNSVYVVRDQSVVKQLSIQDGPDAITYNPDPSGEVLVLSGTNVTTISGDSIVSTYSVLPSGGSSIFYDKYNGLTYISGYEVGSLLIEKGTSISTTIETNGVSGFTVDPTNGLVYGSQEETDSVLVLNGTQSATTVEISPGPAGLAFDTATNTTYVDEETAGIIGELNGTHLSGSIKLPAMTQSPVLSYDPFNNLVYVMNDVGFFGPSSLYSKVYVIDNNSIIGNITIEPFPESMVVNPVNGYVYVVGSYFVEIISGMNVIDSYSISSSLGIFTTISPVFDPLNGYTYLPTPTNGKIMVFNGTDIMGNITTPFNVTQLALDHDTGTLYAIGGTYSTSKGEITQGWNKVALIAGSNVTATIDLGGFHINGVLSSNSASMFDSGNYTTLSIAYDPTTGYIMIGTVIGITLIVNGTTVVQKIYGPAFHHFLFNPSDRYMYADSSSLYQIETGSGHFMYFVESGLPNESAWYVNITGISSSPTLKVHTTYEISDPWNTDIYKFSVYSVMLPNGNYTFQSSTTLNGYLPTYDGYFDVGKTSGSIYITFNHFPGYNTVTFAESGLPYGTTWYLNLSDSSRFSSIDPAISFITSNGTYTFYVSSAGSFKSAPSTGLLTVNGNKVSISIVFSPTSGSESTYAVSFAEKGLPPGTAWSVTFNGSLETSKNNTLLFSAQNGTYSYTIEPEPGYSVALSYGKLVISGSNVTKSIVFSSSNNQSKSPFSGFPNNAELHEIVGGVIAVIAIGAVVTTLRKKK